MTQSHQPTPGDIALDELLDEAEHFQGLGDHAKAVQLCAEALKSPEMRMIAAARIILIFRAAGEDAAAKQIEDGTLVRLRNVVAERRDDPELADELGFVLFKLGHFEEAMPLFERAIDLDPSILRPVYILADIHLQRGNPDKALEAWNRLFAHFPELCSLMLRGAAMLAHFGAQEQALQILERAEPFSDPVRNEFDHIAAGIRGGDANLSQAGLTVELFDGFASSYDNNLTNIGNNGPTMIGRVMEALDLPKKRKLHVLDAGCGTGLCAPFLLPYAKELHGVDLSAGMLTEAQKKGLYNHLTRSDIAMISTLPEGPFDLIVAADVMVYFGALDDPIRNLATLLKPGGLLIFTVERADEDTSGKGWVLQPSGRHKHQKSYLEAQIAKAGLSKPKIALESTLRFEYLRPVPGLALAAQKPLLAL